MTPKFKTPFSFLLLFLLATVHSAWSQNEIKTFFDPPSKITKGVAAGTASLLPNQLTAAQIDDFELVIHVGEGGIKKGGGILVDFPKAWFPSPFPVTKAVQTENSKAPHFVQVHTSRGDDNISIRIEKRNIQNKAERFRHLMRITVDQMALVENDRVMKC